MTLNKQIRNIGFLLAVSFVFSACERKLSDEAVLPSFSKTAEIFTDDFIGMGTNFYLPFADAKPEVFSVDNSEGYESNASIRIDVPNANDPSGSYAGAIFRVDGPGRDLSGYDALTFYVKASQGVVLGNVGFGIDYEEDKYQVTRTEVLVGTNWTKVTVPIPDPSKLTNERGLFWFSAGTQQTNGAGYVLWFDEIKFEEKRAMRMVSAEINNGNNTTVQSFTGSSITLSGLNQEYNKQDGEVITVSSAPAYYSFVSTDTSVAEINNLGVVSYKTPGAAEITATLAGENAIGKLTIVSLGDLPASPTPTRDAADVLSIFSDTYDNATESDFTPGFGGSTTETTALTTSNGEVLQYTSNNFTGIIFQTPLDASSYGYLHIDAYVQDANAFVGVQIRDIGANQTIETNIFNGFPEGDDADYRSTLNGFQTGVWKSFDIPLAGNIANQKDNLGALIITDGPNFILDNIYFYK